MSSTETPLWLLDIDGVINAVSKRPPKGLWDDADWIVTSAVAGGQRWPILAARPVVDFIREAHENALAEIRWHTTWQFDAHNVADALDLPQFKVQERGTPMRVPHWKVCAVNHELLHDRDRRVVWTDDDANDAIRHVTIADMRRLTVICPPTRTGLTSGQLRQLDRILRECGTDE